MPARLEVLATLGAGVYYCKRSCNKEKAETGFNESKVCRRRTSIDCRCSITSRSVGRYGQHRRYFYSIIDGAFA
jgi:hypothetical protein